MLESQLSDSTFACACMLLGVSCTPSQGDFLNGFRKSAVGFYFRGGLLGEGSERGGKGPYRRLA